MLNNIEGFCVYLDYILVCGNTPEEHANRLKLVLEKLSINKKKMSNK